MHQKSELNTEKRFLKQRQRYNDARVKFINSIHYYTVEEHSCQISS